MGTRTKKKCQRSGTKLSKKARRGPAERSEGDDMGNDSNPNSDRSGSSEDSEDKDKDEDKETEQNEQENQRWIESNQRRFTALSPTVSAMLAALAATCQDAFHGAKWAESFLASLKTIEWSSAEFDDKGGAILAITKRCQATTEAQGIISFLGIINEMQLACAVLR